MLSYPYSLPALPYAHDAIAPEISSETMTFHHDNHHNAYVNNLNAALHGTPYQDTPLEELLASISQYPAAIRNNGGGHWNHSFFWTILSPEKGLRPEGRLLEAINRDFESYGDFATAFRDAALSRFGSGWVWLVKDEAGKLHITSTANQDNPLMDTESLRGTPMLGLDVWEHGYYLDYQYRRADYVGAFWNIINWNHVSELYLG